MGGPMGPIWGPMGPPGKKNWAPPRVPWAPGARGPLSPWAPEPMSPKAQRPRGVPMGPQGPVGRKIYNLGPMGPIWGPKFGNFPSHKAWAYLSATVLATRGVPGFGLLPA